MKFTLYCNGPGSTLTTPNKLKREQKYLSQQTAQLRMGTKLPSENSFTVEFLSAGTHVIRQYWIIKYFGLSGSILT
jgi:hypothetical protein